jgi:hypothetical protein
MQTPVEIEYQGMEARPRIQAAVCTENLDPDVVVMKCAQDRV